MTRCRPQCSDQIPNIRADTRERRCCSDTEKIVCWTDPSFLNDRLGDHCTNVPRRNTRLRELASNLPRRVEHTKDDVFNFNHTSLCCERVDFRLAQRVRRRGGFI